MRSKLAKVISIVLVAALVGFIFIRQTDVKSQETKYQTTAVEKGNITVFVTASGQVTQSNSATVDTQASGVVSKVYVQNGQKVKSGDKVAEIDLDLVGKQRSSQAWSSYQSAKNNLETAKNNYFTLHSDLLTNWKSFMEIAQSSTYQNADNSPNTTTRQLPQYMSIDDQWLAAESKYKQQENVVNQLQTSLNTTWLSYQQTSSTIYAPISGTVTGFALQIGSVLTSQSNSSGTATSQKIASIQTDAPPIIQVNLTQIDTPKVKVGDKATIIFDAFSGKTYTGSVISIDTIGSVSSGVTTYPAVIKLDTDVPGLYSNMTAQANIITQTKNDVLLIPFSAVQTQDGQSYVRIMNNSQPQQINIETGLSSSTQVEIVSGLSEGDEVVINATSTSNGTSQQRTNQTQSVFGGFGGGGFRR